MINTVQKTSTMQRLIRFFAAFVPAVALLMIGASDQLVAQQVPQYLSYQGVLTDENRLAVPDGSYTITFRLYTGESGGSPIWQETQTVGTQDGVFDAYLGLLNPLSLPFDQQYWVAAELSGQPEMTPRTRLVPAPYAMTSSRALIADDLEGGFVRNLNGAQGDVTLVGGTGTTVTQDGSQITISATAAEKPLSFGSFWQGDESNRPSELSIGTPGQVLNVNAAGTQAEWTSDLTVNTIGTRRIDVDSLYVHQYANFGGTVDFYDTVNFYGPVNFLFPTTNSLAHKALVVGNDANKMSELPTTNQPGALLMQGADGTPGWGRDLDVRNVNINGQNTTINSTTITVGPANSTTTFEGDVIFNKTPKIALQHNHMLVGGSNGFQTPMAPGPNGSILTIAPNGAPTWTMNPGGLLPAGTLPGTTLRWDGTKWVENNRLRSDEFGNATVSGTLTVSGTEVYLPNGSVQNHELATPYVNVTYGAGVSGSSTVTLGGTLNIQNTGVVAVTGTPNQVSATTNGGTVTLSTPQNIDMDATPTFDGITLDNLTGGSSANQVLVSNGGQVETRSAASLFSEVSLSQNAIWVGNAQGEPAELGAGSEGQVLRISSGAPSWQSSMELPAGTTTNSTLVWNGSAWVENTNVTMDPANGNTVVQGDVTVNGSLKGAGANRYAGTLSIPVNSYQVSVPYSGIQAGASINVSVSDSDANIGIVPARVVSVTPGVGFTVQLAINYDSSTGVLNYVVVNP